MNTHAFSAGPLAEASVRQDGDGWTLMFVRDFNHPPARVWSALTDPAQLAEWSPYAADRDLGSTGPAVLTMLGASTSEDSSASVTVANPPNGTDGVLQYAWGDDVLRWDVSATSAGTRLTLSHSIPDRDRAPQMAAGWHLCLAVAEHLLDGDPIAPIRGDEAMDYGWQELHDAYAAEFGTARPAGPA